MQADLPHTLYKGMRKDMGGKSAKKVRTKPVSATDPAFRKQQEAYERALARKKAQMEGMEPYTMNELFSK